MTMPHNGKAPYDQMDDCQRTRAFTAVAFISMLAEP
jgi:hypothetical protein